MIVHRSCCCPASFWIFHWQHPFCPKPIPLNKCVWWWLTHSMIYLLDFENYLLDFEIIKLDFLVDIACHWNFYGKWLNKIILNKIHVISFIYPYRNHPRPRFCDILALFSSTSHFFSSAALKNRIPNCLIALRSMKCKEQWVKFRF